MEKGNHRRPRKGIFHKLIYAEFKTNQIKIRRRKGRILIKHSGYKTYPVRSLNRKNKRLAPTRSLNYSEKVFTQKNPK